MQTNNSKFRKDMIIMKKLLQWVSLFGLAMVLSGCRKAATKPAVATSSKKTTVAKVTPKAASTTATSKKAHQVNYPFKAIVHQTMGALAGKNAVFIQTTTGQTYEWHNRAQKAASDIKLFILATIYQQVDAGKLNLATNYTLKASDKVGGTGNVQGMAAGTVLTYQQLVHAMMTVSDNTATNIMIKAVGGRAVVNREIKHLGATQTALRRNMMDQQALAAGRDNVTSARDLGQLLMTMWHRQLVSKSASQAMLTLLAENTNQTKLPKLIPSARKVYNKTGEFDTYGVENDAAIFAHGQQAVVVVALSQGGQLPQQIPAMNQLGQRVDAAVFKAD